MSSIHQIGMVAAMNFRALPDRLAPLPRHQREADESVHQRRRVVQLDWNPCGGEQFGVAALPLAGFKIPLKILQSCFGVADGPEG